MNFVDDWLSVDVGSSGLARALRLGPPCSLVLDVLGKEDTAERIER